MVSRIVNPQFSKSVGELVLDLVVNSQFSRSVRESQFGDFASTSEFVKSRRGELSINSKSVEESFFDGEKTHEAKSIVVSKTSRE